MIICLVLYIRLSFIRVFIRGWLFLQCARKFLLSLASKASPGYMPGEAILVRFS